MLLVIFGHACAFWSGHWFTENPSIESHDLSILYAWVGSFHIYAFTLVSGYIFAFKIRAGGYSMYVPFLQNKAKRLLVPYLFVMLIWVAPISAYFFHWDLPHLFKRYILCIDPSQLWFLWMLFGVFSIVWPLKNVMMERSIVGWIVSLAFYGVGIAGKRMLPNIFCIWTSCQYVTFFFFGMRIRSREKAEKKPTTETVPWFVWIIADVFIFIGTLLIDRQEGMIWSLMSIGANYVLHILGSIMAWTTLQALANRIPWQSSKVFKTLSSCSMPMYLFHQQIIYVTIAWLNGKINPWVHAGINFAVALIGSLLISVILIRWKITRTLIGEK